MHAVLPISGRWALPLLLLGLSAACGGGTGAPPAPPAPAAAERLRLAVASFNAGAPTEPMDARVSAAGSLLVNGRYEEARAALEPLVREKPDAARARFYLAAAIHKSQRYAEARPHFEAVLAAGPRFPKADAVFALYGWCLYWNGDPESADAAFEAALGFHPDDRDAVFGRGVVALERGDAGNAAGLLERAASLAEAARDPRDVARAKARIADVHLLLDRPAEARRALEESLRIFPDHAEVWHKLASVCTRLGDAAAARAARAEGSRRRPQ